MRPYLILFLIAISPVLVNAQQRTMIAGIVLDPESGKGVAAAHVLNLTDSLATITSPEGAFKIPVQLGDSLVFSSIGYHMRAIIISEKQLLSDFLQINMAARDYQLSEVEVNPLGTKDQFRKKFMDLEVDDGSIEIAGIKKPPVDPRTIPVTEDKNEIKKAKYLLSPASFIYGNLSKDAKARQELHRLEAEKEKHRYNYQKFNDPKVENITGYTGEKLHEFMDFCNFSEADIYRMSEYELTIAILNKQKSYEASKRKSE